MTVSAMGQFASQVQSVVSSDPEQARAVIKRLAAEIRVAPDGVSGSKAKRMSEFATRLEAVAETGDAHGLTPGAAGGPPPGGPPPPSSTASDDETSLLASLVANLESAAGTDEVAALASGRSTGATSRGLAAYAQQDADAARAGAESFFASLSARLDSLVTA
jgi:hypothetical protein